MNIANVLASMVHGTRAMFPAPPGLTPTSEDPPPGEGLYGISNVVNVGLGQYYQPSHHKACLAGAQRTFAFVSCGIDGLYARREAGLPPVYAGETDALALIPRKGPVSDIAQREALYAAMCFYTGLYALRTEDMPEPLSREAFARMIKKGEA